MHAKPVKMLVSLKSDSVRYASQVAKTVDCTYSHTVKVLENFKDLGLVKFEKKGRIKIIKLTDVGLEVAHDFEGIHRKFLKIKIPSPESFSEKSKK
jgi:predicted transcriptional regulator